MNTCKKIVLFALILVAIISFFCFNNMNVYSANYYEILSKRVGTIDEGETRVFSFNVPVESNITVKFLGDDSEYIGTYGDYYLEILDSSGIVRFQKEGSNGYDDENIYTKLQKGDYTLKIKENGYYTFDYVFYIIGSPTANYTAQTVKLNKNKINLKKGKKETLSVAISPNYVTGDIQWSSNNKNVATVNSVGQVTAKNLGIAKITAMKDGKNALCTVTVNKTDTKKIIYKKITSFSKYVKYIKKNKKAKWSSSNKKIATVNKKGKVTAKKTGKCNIICKVGKQKYTIPIKVVKLVTASLDGIDDVLIYNDAWVRITNNSNKKIKYMTLDIKQYDNKGSKLRSPYDYYYINDTIKADSAESYKFWVNDDTKKIKVKITKVWFSDGSKWNP